MSNNKHFKAKQSSHPRRVSRPRPIKPTLVLFNKPFGVLTQFTGEPGDATLKDYIPVPNIYPCGRLDKDSEGLLVLTDDGKLQAQLADPKYKTNKTYYVLVEGLPSEANLQRLRQGVELKDGLTRPADVELVTTPEWLWPRNPPVRTRQSIQDYWLKLTIGEGRNRQVRRMTAAIGHPTLRLIRWQVGPWSLDNLATGAWLDRSDVAIEPKKC